MTRAGDVLAPLDDALRVLRGHPLTRGERDAFARYLDLLMRWNRTHDLTACRTQAEVVTALFRDSLLFQRLLPEADALRAVDIGAGAGIPGVPLRIVMPSLHVTLIESRRKRASFLKAVQREMDLPGIEVLEGRAERIIAQHTDYVGGYDVALARGVPADLLLEAAAPYLAAGGVLIAGGPPRPGDAPRNAAYAIIEWRREDYRALRTSRTFLVARK